MRRLGTALSLGLFASLPSLAGAQHDPRAILFEAPAPSEAMLCRGFEPLERDLRVGAVALTFTFGAWTRPGPSGRPTVLAHRSYEMVWDSGGKLLSAVGQHLLLPGDTVHAEFVWRATADAVPNGHWTPFRPTPDLQRERLTAEELRRVAGLGALLWARRCRGTFPPPSETTRSPRSVTIGDRSWLLSCTGTGTPTVLLEAGHNESVETWRTVQARVATFTRVCSYDRAGVGRSSPPRASSRRTGQTVVQELKVLLDAAGVDGPYLMVGHSLGGAFVRLFAAAHPADVTGLVLVDAVSEREAEEVLAMLSAEQRAPGDGAAMQPLSPEGIAIETVLAELRALPRPIPQDVVVVARGLPLASEEMPPTWRPEQRRRREAIRTSAQAALAQLSRAGRLVVATRSGHFVHHDEPALVVAAIRSLVKR